MKPVSASSQLWFLLSSRSRSIAPESAPWEDSSLLIFSPSEISLKKHLCLHTSGCWPLQIWKAPQCTRGNKSILRGRAPLSLCGRVLLPPLLHHATPGWPTHPQQVQSFLRVISPSVPLARSSIPPDLQTSPLQGIPLDPALQKSSLCPQLPASLLQPLQTYSPTCSFLSVCRLPFL